MSGGNETYESKLITKKSTNTNIGTLKKTEN